jgi:hypothetical protein
MVGTTGIRTAERKVSRHGRWSVMMRDERLRFSSFLSRHLADKVRRNVEARQKYNIGRLCCSNKNSRNFPNRELGSRRKSRQWTTTTSILKLHVTCASYLTVEILKTHIKIGPADAVVSRLVLFWE